MDGGMNYFFIFIAYFLIIYLFLINAFVFSVCVYIYILKHFNCVHLQGCKLY